MGSNFSFGAMLPLLCFDEIFPTMHRVEHRQLTAHRTHGPVVSNVFHCKRPRSLIPSLFHLLRKSHYDYATEPFFDLLDTRTSSGPYPRDSGRRRLSDHIESRCARRCHPLVLICRSPEYVGRCSSRRPPSSASSRLAGGIGREPVRLQTKA